LPEDFKSDPTLLTGEHVSPKFFEEDSLLRDWADVAQALAEYPWPQLYSPQAMRASQVKGAAAVYFRDAYVPAQFSLETAALVPGLQTWVTSEYEHNGVRASGGAVFARLHELATGKVLR
jgi:possible prolyl aminopeptidase